jgi:hypothetical protein
LFFPLVAAQRFHCFLQAQIQFAFVVYLKAVLSFLGRLVALSSERLRGRLPALVAAQGDQCE